jgi:hypothetical protein
MANSIPILKFLISFPTISPPKTATAKATWLRVGLNTFIMVDGEL